MIRSLMFACAALIAGLCAPSTALADSTRLLSHKAWQVHHFYSAETGRQVCTAETYNTANQDMLMIGLRENGSVGMSITTRRPLWSHKFQDDLVLDVDFERWTLTNANFDTVKGASRVRFDFEPGPQLGRFITHLYDGRAIALKAPDGTRTLISWSLAGSAAALMKWGECGDRISTRARGGAGSGYGASRSGYGASRSGYGTY